MHKVVTPDEMRTIEERAIYSGITEDELMDRAGKGLALYIETIYPKSRDILLIAGKGNNGGDGYTAGCYLIDKGYTIKALQLPDEESSTLLKRQKERFISKGGRVIQLSDTIPQIDKSTLVIDAIFGIGFHGSVEGITQKAIQQINQSKAEVIAVDIPSGVQGEGGEVHADAIKASTTCAIEFPKTGLFFGKGWNHAGKVVIIPIGLSTFSLSTKIEYAKEEDIASLLPPLLRNRHKYQAGDVVGIAGSPGMLGAAILSGWAALCTGAGIVHMLLPESLRSESLGPPWELVKVFYTEGQTKQVIDYIHQAKACFVGPGLGSSQEIDTMLRSIWNEIKIKTIIDADAINWAAKILHLKNDNSSQLFSKLPLSIFTPHIGEMSRLLGKKIPEDITLDALEECQQFVNTHETHLVLKGAPTFLLSFGKPSIIMPRGDPGMATAGSGDVLTGILASLLAQGLLPSDVMLLGTYLHALAGEAAAADETSYCITASSLIHYLPDAIKQIGHFSTL